MVVGDVPTPSIGDRGRRLAAVWCCDVVGSTEIAAELGDRRFRWLIGRYLAVARSALRRHGGREINTAGDGMFAIFDAPATALRAAFEFRLGRVHGMFCLGCCWALMLVGFAASMANLWWMPRSPR